MSRYCRGIPVNSLGGARNILGSDGIDAALQTGGRKSATAEATSALLLLSSAAASDLGRQPKEIKSNAESNRILGTKSRDFERKNHDDQRTETPPKRRRLGSVISTEACNSENKTRNNQKPAKAAAHVPLVVRSGESSIDSRCKNSSYSLGQTQSRDVSETRASETCISNNPNIAGGTTDSPYLDPATHYERQLFLRRQLGEQQYLQLNNWQNFPASSVSLHLPHWDIFVFPTNQSVRPIEVRIDSIRRDGRSNPNIYHSQTSRISLRQQPKDTHAPGNKPAVSGNNKDVEDGKRAEKHTSAKEGDFAWGWRSAHVPHSVAHNEYRQRSDRRSGGAAIPSKLHGRSLIAKGAASVPQVLSRSIPEAPTSSATGTTFNKDIANRMFSEFKSKGTSDSDVATGLLSLKGSQNDEDIPQSLNLVASAFHSPHAPFATMREVPKVPTVCHTCHIPESSDSQAGTIYTEATLAAHKTVANKTMNRVDSEEDSDENEHPIATLGGATLGGATTVVYELSRNDYLLGHGGYSRCYPGNKRARQSIQLLLPSFAGANKAKRRLLAERVVRNVYAHGGRFLTEVNGMSKSTFDSLQSHSTSRAVTSHRSNKNKNGRWVVLSQKEAVRKIGQRFREDLNGPRDKRAMETSLS